MPGQLCFSPRKCELNPKSILTPHAKKKKKKKKKKKIGHSCVRKSVICPRKSQASLTPSGYVPDRIGVESYQNCALIAS